MQREIKKGCSRKRWVEGIWNVRLRRQWSQTLRLLHFGEAWIRPSPGPASLSSDLTLAVGESDLADRTGTEMIGCSEWSHCILGSRMGKGNPAGRGGRCGEESWEFWVSVAPRRFPWEMARISATGVEKKKMKKTQTLELLLSTWQGHAFLLTFGCVRSRV